MQDSDWDDFRYFLAVGDQGSISAAAKFLRVNHSTVLRRVAGFEKRLGVRLFDRLPDGYAITAAGAELRKELRGVKDRIDAAQRNLSGRDLGLSGVIRVTAPDTLLRPLIMPCLAEFRARQPGIRLDLVVTNTFLTLAKHEADVAIRPANTVPENLIGRRAGKLRTAIYGSTAYLAQYGGQKPWADYDWIAPAESLSHLGQARWLKKHVPESRIVMKVDSLAGMVNAVLNGVGVGMLLTLLADDEKGLIRLEEPAPALDTDVWVLSHRDVRRVARIKALTEFLYDRLSKNSKLAAVSRRSG
jgi:DNA-binding transcriptional LysR family regulator